MTRLTIDPSGTVRHYDDDGRLLRESQLADQGVADTQAWEPAVDERGGWLWVWVAGLSLWGLIVGVGLLLLHIRWP